MKDNPKMIKNTRKQVNYVYLTARVTGKPTIEFKKTRNAKELIPYVEFPMACNSSATSTRYVTFFSICAWGKLAQEMYDILQVGYEILVIGRFMTIFKHETGKDGAFIQQSLIEAKDYTIRHIPDEEIEPEEAQENEKPDGPG